MAGPSNSYQRLRPLLPQLTPPLPPAPAQIAPRKRSHIRSACETCRLRKSRCSGERPRCNLCIQRGLQCYYETATAETRPQALRRKYNELKSRKSPYEDLFDLLKTVSERDAQDILARVRSGADVETVLNHVANGDLLLQLAMVPETRYRYEFPYISKMPENLLADDNPYLQSLIYEAAAIYPVPKQSTAPKDHSWSQHMPFELSAETYLQGHDFKPHETVYLKPYHAAEVVDPRLSNVKISSWTSVCDDDVLMRKIINAWLRCEYHFTAAFQKDLFFEDMTAQRQDFCSSLLVNVILGYACVCYPRFSERAQYWNPRTLVYRFIAEAKRLWELEALVPRITTIQAGILFNVFYNLCGLDEVGQAYRLQALALAHEIRLFNSANHSQSERIRHGKAYTAWALFNWETLVGFSFMFAPLLKNPPDWPLPDPSKEPQWYGEIWFKYPLSNLLIPTYFGQVFRARSEFRVIMNDACQVAYSKGSELTLEKADDLLSRLKAWYNRLTGPLLPKTIVLPGHLQLHIYYHHLILTIFEPLLDAKTTRELSPERIVTDATKYLQTLVRLYYIRHGYEAMDLFIVIPLMLMASDCLDAISEQTPASQLETLRSTLILVAKGLHAQRKNHYLAEALFRVIRGRMRPDEVALFRGTMNIDDDNKERPDMVQTVRSHWPVSVVKKKSDLESYILANLVENYAHLNTE